MSGASGVPPSGDLRHGAAFLRGPGGYWYAASATLVGELVIGEGANIWYGTVLRGDDAPITVGARTNLQDLTMVHADPGKPLVIGEDVTIGHRAIIHCLSIGARSLIGMGSILMEDVVIGEESLVAAGTVVPPGTIVPPRSLVRGVPGRIARETTAEERAMIVRAGKKYAANAVEFFRRYGA